MVEESRVEKSGVAKSGVEMSSQCLELKLGVEKSGVELSSSTYNLMLLSNKKWKVGHMFVAFSDCLNFTVLIYAVLSYISLTFFDWSQ